MLDGKCRQCGKLIHDNVDNYGTWESPICATCTEKGVSSRDSTKVTTSIGIIGGGVVGKATARAFMEHAEVKVYDVAADRATHSLDDTLASDLIFVCLPTPMRTTGHCDTSFIEAFFATIAYEQRSLNFVLRSTVPIGFTRKLSDRFFLTNIVHSPEFLTARCANTDAQIPSRNIIGNIHQRGTLWSNGNRAAESLNILYHTRFVGTPCYLMSSDESEAVKLFLNGFFAVKVAYWNEVQELASKAGLDWNRVMQGVLSDGRVAHSHTNVPGPDDKFGFGGECLPKDLANLIKCIEFEGDIAHICNAAQRRNEEDRKR